jgi:tetratricopeptide (TPR) repeat protein
MAAQVIDIKCPNCGAAVDTSQKTCKFCKSPVIISTFNSVFEMPAPLLNKYAGAYKQALAESPENKELNNSIAMCFLKLKLYNKAIASFERVMEDNFDNSETFFYASICLLGGKKAFLAQRTEIDKIEKCINTVLMIEPRGIYHYFWAYIKYDYLSRKSFDISPTYQEAMKMASGARVCRMILNNYTGFERFTSGDLKVYKRTS